MSSKWIKYGAACLAALIMCLSCGTGDDDGSRLGDVIVGSWYRDSLALESDSIFDPEDFTHHRFDFRGDGSYNGMVRQGSFTSISRFGNVINEGTYKCDNDNLRMEYVDDEGVKQTVLSRILSYTDSTIYLNSKFDSGEIDVYIKMWLKKGEAPDDEEGE